MKESGWFPGRRVSLIVKGALLPGHGLDGAWHRGRLERGCSVRMEGVANGVDGGEGPLGGQRKSVLVLRLEGGGRGRRENKGEESERKNSVNRGSAVYVKFRLSQLSDLCSVHTT